MTEESPTAKSLFLDAIENHSAAQWPGFLDRECGGNRQLRRQVEQLLAAHQRPDTLLDLGLTVSIPAGGDNRIGTTVGNYTLLEELGDGGMGLVYRARQEWPVRREVALKMIKPGMDTRQVIARFEAERQALALMDHPHIARVLDGGAAENGRPYFVMEIVRGVPITRFCRENGLTVRQRVELFLTVCQAVEHAHQKGIIHRDLKPSNILVTRVDERPTPKVIDFGIAKALHEPLTECSVCTVGSQLLGTPAYMSPEQVQMDRGGVDTRTDVYSLGVVLYEILTEGTPHDRAALKAADYIALRQIVCETEPTRPSDRVAGQAERDSGDGRQRSASSRKLAAQLRGELDCIVLRAIAIDREERYQSVAALADDVERYLRDEPIEASPPSSLYRLQKLVRRRKGAFAAGALVFLSLMVGLIASTLQAIRATNAEREVEDRLDEVDQQRNKALAAQATAELRETEVRRLLYASDMTLASEA